MIGRLTAWLVHLAVLAVGITGLVYGWMRYFVEPTDEFAVVHHPAEPMLHELHVLFAPILVFATGMIWLGHVSARIRGGIKERRGTGIALAALLPPMVASGYLIQVVVDERWRAVWIWTHGISSTLWLLLYLVHQLQRARVEPLSFELEQESP